MFQAPVDDTGYIYIYTYIYTSSHQLHCISDYQWPGDSHHAIPSGYPRLPQIQRCQWPLVASVLPPVGFISQTGLPLESFWVFEFLVDPTIPVFTPNGNEGGKGKSVAGKFRFHDDVLKTVSEKWFIMVENHSLFYPFGIFWGPQIPGNCHTPQKLPLHGSVDGVASAGGSASSTNAKEQKMLATRMGITSCS